MANDDTDTDHPAEIGRLRDGNRKEMTVWEDGIMFRWLPVGERDWNGGYFRRRAAVRGVWIEKRKLFVRYDDVLHWVRFRPEDADEAERCRETVEAMIVPPRVIEVDLDDLAERPQEFRDRRIRVTAWVSIGFERCYLTDVSATWPSRDSALGGVWVTVMAKSKFLGAAGGQVEGWRWLGRHRLRERLEDALFAPFDWFEMRYACYRDISSDDDDIMIGSTNAGLYRKDGLTHAGYMKNYDHINNALLGKDQAVLAFNRTDDSVPEAQIIDREFLNFDDLRHKYHTLIQGIRMLDSERRNVWRQQSEQWSMVVIGRNIYGEALFIFTRSPYSVHDFINILLELPLHLTETMYLAGGPSASLYFKHRKTELELLGSYETSTNENDDNHRARPIPNVIGIVAKENR